MSEKQVEGIKSQLAKTDSKTSIKDMIELSVEELGKALPSHMNAERLVRIALTTLRTNPMLYKCEPQSFLAALFQSAQLGLEPNIEGQAYIIPYKSKTGMVAQFQIGYKGFVELFWRHQSALGLQMECVHEQDVFKCDIATSKIEHRLPPYNIERGEVVAYYAVAKLKGGGQTVKVMSKKDVEAFAKKHTKCFDKTTGQFKAYTPWAEYFDAMALKTVLKQLMKLLPKSVELQKAISMDETVKVGLNKDMFLQKDVSDKAGIEEGELKE